MTLLPTTPTASPAFPVPASATTAEPLAEVAILGAGPGGAATALHLARAGIGSVVFDKAAFPRDKVCGDALSGKVISELRRLTDDADALPALLRAEPQQVPSWGISFIAPNGETLRVPFKTGFDKAADYAPGHLMRRLDFDDFLVRRVRAQPLIQLRENTAVERWERASDGIWTLFGKGTEPLARARLLVAADGAQSRFGRTIGGHTLEPEHHCAGLRAYYRGVRGLDPDNFIELHFLPDFLPGYLWIFPLPDGAANVGVGMLTSAVSKKKVNLRQRLTEIIQESPALRARFAGATLEGPVQGFGLPLGSRMRPISGDGYLLVGDAGSLIDPFSGEGISNALIAGRHAADWAGRALAAHDFSGALLQGYDAAVYRRLGPELRVSRRLQQLLAFPRLFNFVVKRANSNPALAELISSMFNDLDLRQRLRQPSFYARLLVGR